MSYTINLDENLISFVEKSALADNVSVEVWCERKINGNVKRLMKDQAISAIESSSIENVITYVDAVETVKSDIKAANEARLEIPAVEESTETTTTTP